MGGTTLTTAKDTTYAELSSCYGVDVDRLRTANGWADREIPVEQPISVPEDPHTMGWYAPRPNEVRSAASLRKIADDHGLSVAALYEANRSALHATPRGQPLPLLCIPRAPAAMEEKLLAPDVPAPRVQAAPTQTSQAAATTSAPDTIVHWPDGITAVPLNHRPSEENALLQSLPIDVAYVLWTPGAQPLPPPNSTRKDVSAWLDRNARYFPIAGNAYEAVRRTGQPPERPTTGVRGWLDTNVRYIPVVGNAYEFVVQEHVPFPGAPDAPFYREADE